MLTSSLNPSTFGQSVTFTATVTPPGATGAVDFRNNSTGALLGSDLLNANGMASMTTSALPVGSHSIVAQYAGDANFGPSTSAPLVQTVSQVTTTTTLASSLNPSSSGQAVTFTATVTPLGATGQVSFRDSNTVIGSASLNASGMATLSISSLSGGSHSITAVFPGDGNSAASTSAALTQVVNSISLMTTQTSANVSRGGTATFQLAVGQAGTLSSPIIFSCSGLPAGWSCGFNPTSVPAGSGSTPVTLTIQAGNAIAQNLPRTPIESPGLQGNILPGALALLMLGIHLTARRRKAAWLRFAAALGFTALLLLAAGCGSSGPPQPVTVNFTVNATSGSTTASIPFSITVR
jgi:hypothetical protein